MKKSENKFTDFNEEQLEQIEYGEYQFKVDFSKGYYYQFYQESEDDEDTIEFTIAPKDDIYFDHHSSPETFMNEEDSNLCYESSEGTLNFNGTEKEFDNMIAKYDGFFEKHKF